MVMMKLIMTLTILKIKSILCDDSVGESIWAPDFLRKITLSLALLVFDPQQCQRMMIMTKLVDLNDVNNFRWWSLLIGLLVNDDVDTFIISWSPQLYDGQLLVDLLVKLMISTNNDQWLVDLLVAGTDRVPPLPPSKHQSPKPEWHHADHDHHDHPNDDDDHHHNHHDNDDDYHGEDDHHEDDDSEAPIDQA